nr:L316 [uncultured bacterium]
MTITTFQNASVDKLVAEQAAGILDCPNANQYSFVVVKNPNGKSDSDPLIPEDVHIIVGDDVISKIELPRVDSQLKNFSLNSIEKTKAGFEMKVDWGGGLFHYEIQFNFKCQKNHFYLYEVKKQSFSTSNPDSGNFLDKKESKVIKIKPYLPIEKFVMTDYL